MSLLGHTLKWRKKFSSFFSILFYSFLYCITRSETPCTPSSFSPGCVCASFQRPSTTINNVLLFLSFPLFIFVFLPSEKGWTQPKSAGETRGSCLVFKENHKFQGYRTNARARAHVRCSFVRRGTTAEEDRSVDPRWSSLKNPSAWYSSSLGCAF